jgi:outer membrane receptor protein involved in Fe transport
VTGVGGLTRYSFAWLIIPVLAFAVLYSGPRRVNLALIAFLAFVGVMAPWVVRNYALWGRIIVRENFGYTVTDDNRFDRDTPPVFAFADRGHDREQALFAQDQIRLGAWTVNAGVRWDHYSLVVDESAISPRLGVAWSWPAANLVVRASYDRAFQTPAVENLLLASSTASDTDPATRRQVHTRPTA